MASVAICTAVWNPNVTSVPTMSLSIVFGTPTIGSPCSSVQLAGDASASRCRRSRSARRGRGRRTSPRTSSTPARWSNGLPRLVPSTVPPRGSVPRIVSTVSGIVRRSRTPSQASRKPIDLVAVDPLALADDGPDHGVQPGAVAAAGEDADSHAGERSGRRDRRRRRAIQSPPMGWDASRPVPWRRLVKEWLIYAAIMAAIFVVALPRRRPGRAAPRPACSSAARCTSASATCWPSSATQRKTLAASCARRGVDVDRRRRRRRRRRHAAAARRRPGAPRRGPNRAAGEAAVTRRDVRHRHRRRHDRHPQPGRRSSTAGRRSSSYREFTQHFPQPGWVEHDAAEIWDAVRATLDRRRRAGRARRRRRDRHHQPARDRRRVGPRDGRARTAGRSCGRTAAPPPAATSSPRRARSTSCASAPGSCSTRTSAARSSSGCCASGGVPVTADLALGTIDAWIDLEPHRRRGPRHRRHQRQPHDAVRHHARCGGTTSCADLLHVPGRPPARGRRRRAAGSASRRTAAASPPGIPVSGIAGDQQAALFGQACIDAGDGQEHLRHGQLRAAERRRRRARRRPRGC